MNNLLSYCGLVDAKIKASDKDLTVNKFKIYKSKDLLCVALYFSFFVTTKINYSVLLVIVKTVSLNLKQIYRIIKMQMGYQFT